VKARFFRLHDVANIIAACEGETKVFGSVQSFSHFCFFIVREVAGYWFLLDRFPWGPVQKSQAMVTISV